MTPQERRENDRARWRAYDAAHRAQRHESEKFRRLANPDKFKAKNAAYHAAHRDEILARQKARRTQKRDEISARKRAWRLSHPEEARAQAKRQRESVPKEERRRREKIYQEKYKSRHRAWTERNQERLKALAAKWTRDNRHRVRAKVARRRAQKLRATPPWANHEAINRFYEEADRLTKQTRVKYEVDHIVPLINPRVCGLHVESNLRVVTQRENRSKNNRLIAA